MGEGDARQIVCGAWNFEAGATVAVALPGAFLPGLRRAARRARAPRAGLARDDPGRGRGRPRGRPRGDHGAPRRVRAGHAARRRAPDPRPGARRHADRQPGRPALDGRASRARSRRSSAASSIRRSPTIPTIVDREEVDVTVEDFDGCPRYIGRVFRDVAIGPSPQWLRSRLFLADMRSISNVVDVTNYVMHVWGSPLHAFDRAKLADGRIVVRRARAGRGAAHARRDRCAELDAGRPADHRRRAAPSRSRRSWAARTARSRTRRPRCCSRRRTSSRSGSCARPSGSRSAPPARTGGRRASTRTSPRTPPMLASRLLVDLAGARMTGHVDVHAGLPERPVVRFRPERAIARDRARRSPPTSSARSLARLRVRRLRRLGRDRPDLARARRDARGRPDRGGRAAAARPHPAHDAAPAARARPAHEGAAPAAGRRGRARRRRPVGGVHVEPRRRAIRARTRSGCRIR